MKSVLSCAAMLLIGTLAQPTLAQDLGPASTQQFAQQPTSKTFLSQSQQGSAAPISAEKEQLIREYLAVTQATATATQMVAPLIPLFQDAYPQVPAVFFEKLLAEIDENALVEALIPVFAKNLTDAELTAAIAFYKTPEGAALIQKTPVLIQESQAAGEAWGTQLGERIIRELQEQGYTSET